MWRVGFVVAATACTFTPGKLPGSTDDARTDGTPGDGSGSGNDDAMQDDAMGPTACVQSWLSSNGPTFGSPTRLTQLATALTEGDPFVSRDGLRLYFARSGDVWLSTRASTSAAWGTPAVDSTLSSAQSDSKVSFTDDELTVFVNSSRSGSTSDVWRGTRSSIGASWTFDRTYLATVNGTGDSQWDPHISGDGLRIYFAPTGTGLAMQLVWMASRSATDQPFGTPQQLSVNSTIKDNDPTVTLDERVIVWASDRTGDRGLWFAKRANATEPWGPATELTALNTMATSEDGPHVSADGCQLYFTSNRAGGSGADDLYVVDVN